MEVVLNPTIPTATVAGLFIAFGVKHVLADYILQTAAMVHGKEARHGWLRPLALHAGIHAAGTLALALAFSPAFWWLAVADFVLHGAIDRAKAILGGHGRWQPAEARFWWLHGADQALHHLCHFAFLLVLAGAAAA